jgi:hypothetical protein
MHALKASHPGLVETPEKKPIFLFKNFSIDVFSRVTCRSQSRR